jgi:hypothetical protein
MVTEKSIEQSRPHQAPISIGRRADWRRWLAFAAAVVFPVSSVFPVAAGLPNNTESFPKWWGTLIALILAGLAFAVILIGRGSVTQEVEHATCRAYRLDPWSLCDPCDVCLFRQFDRLVELSNWTWMASVAAHIQLARVVRVA